MLAKIKDFVKRNTSEIVFLVAITLIATFSFSIGIITCKIEGEQKDNLYFEMTEF